MQLPQHGIVGLYPSRDAAESARVQIMALGIEPGQIRLLQRALVRLVADDPAERHGPRQDPTEGGAAGIAAGTAATATDPFTLAVPSCPHVSANLASGALYLLGGGIGFGSLVGAESSRGDVSTLIKQALAAGQAVLVIHGRSGEEILPVTETVRQAEDPATPARARVAPRLALVPR